MNSVANNKALNKVLNVFETSFKDVYRSIKVPNKVKLLHYTGVVFKKWYYSTLLDGTVFSPANMFCLQASNKDAIAVPTVKVESNGNAMRLNFEVVEYSANDHPIVKDLKILVEHFNPDVEINDDNYLLPEKVAELMNIVTLYDPYYVEYLTALAFKLKLVKRLLSIHSCKAQVTEDSKEFFSKSKKEQLKNIVDAAIEICAHELSTIVPSSAKIFNVGFVKGLLENPLTADEIFESIYSKLGINIGSILEKHSQQENGVSTGLNEFEAAIVSSTFYLGSTLDQWFLSPFGQYLQIIQPFYYFAYNYTNELYFLIDSLNSNNEIVSSVFAPCTFYSLTTVGEKFYKKKAREYDLPTFQRGMNMNEIIDSLLNDIMFSKFDDIEKQVAVPKIVEIKVKLQNDKRCWKTLEIETSGNLHELHAVLSYTFKFDPLTKYSFYTSQTPSPFCEYAAPWAEGKTKKADQFTVEEIFADVKKVLYNTNTVYNFEIELIKFKDGISDVSYPRIIKKSKQMEAAEGDKK